MILDLSLYVNVIGQVRLILIVLFTYAGFQVATDQLVKWNSSGLFGIVLSVPEQLIFGVLFSTGAFLLQYAPPIYGSISWISILVLLIYCFTYGDIYLGDILKIQYV